MSVFDDIDAELASAMEDEFGDTAVLSPIIKTEYGEAPSDPARPSKPVKGIFSSGPVIGKLDGDSRGQAFNVRRATEVASFWLSAAEVAAIGYDIKPEDRLTVTGRSTVFRVVAVLPTSQGDAELHLTQ